MALLKLTPQEEDVMIGPHFSSAEFRCPCCKQLSIELKLVDKLELLRSEINHPIFITSGYRCPKHNREIGGARRSRHLISDAADIKAAIDLIDFFSIAVKIFPRVGLYDTDFLHVDLLNSTLYWVRIGGKYTYFKCYEDAIIYFIKNIK